MPTSSTSSLDEVRAELRAFGPEMTVVSTAPTYLFWRCAPPELRVPKQTVAAIRDVAGALVAVGPHGSATPAAVLEKLGVDVVVMGECEETLARLADGEKADAARRLPAGWPWRSGSTAARRRRRSWIRLPSSGRTS